MRFPEEDSSLPALRKYLGDVGYDERQLDESRLHRLHRDLDGLDAVLKLAPDGVLWRIATSVKTLILCDGWAVIETRRSFEGEPFKEGRKPWSVSETKKRGEYPIDCARRGVIEELSPHLDIERCIREGLIEIRPVPYYSPQERRKSRVYPNIMSLTELVRFVWDAPEWLLGDRGPIEIVDSGTRVHLECFPESEVRDLIGPVDSAVATTTARALQEEFPVATAVPEEMLALLKP